MQQKTFCIKNRYISLILSFFLGNCIWFFSPIIIGNKEPWDSESFYFVLSLFITGACVGYFFPRRIWIIYLGILFGQIIYMLIFLPTGPLMFLGLVYLAAYSLLALAGAFCTSNIKIKYVDKLKA